MQKGILSPFPDAALSVLTVWIAMMDTDTLGAAQEAAGKFTDPRVEQFFDSSRIAGKAFAHSLGHEGEVAWDFYLFYPAGAEWGELPPMPEAYMHQLTNTWANPECLFEKRRLKTKLNKTMKSFFP